MTTTDATPCTLEELLAVLAEAREDVQKSEPTEPNRYHDARFFSHESRAGTLRDSTDERLVRFSVVELAALFAPLDGDTVYRAGQLAALRDLARFVPRFEAEAGRPLEKMNFGRVLHSWWWPMRARGWGALQIDMSHQQTGLMLAILEAAPAPKGATCESIARFLAGMFAVAFGLLARRELACRPLPIGLNTSGSWKYLIATPKRIRAAEQLIEDGFSESELLDRLSQAASLVIKRRPENQS